MNTFPPAKKTCLSRLRMGIAMVAICSLAVSQAHAAGTASEQANVEIMIRELNALEAVARRSGELPNDGSQRYHFDYQRLAADIARMRQGLQDYLTPSRAQPRDTTELSGHYTTNSDRQP